jgi:hypothetical protein
MFSSLLSREATFKVSGGVSLWTVTLFFCLFPHKKIIIRVGGGVLGG